ncbi:integrase [Enterovibrio norvegicus FF-33]|uniref:tyrosine-type recombinase/integrase n=1 Tax=Enterovibrio norvegicus TaxID=188144 RepID=UPI00031F9AF3|nr:tyrosine-type recombinase/integrase [Enterovibrio norvegicus]OEE69831.1 integrase [Enterovibrio norvegicus FF-33]
MTTVVKPLTDTQIKHAKAKTEDYALCDGFGLYLLIRKSGTKSWQLRYQHPITNNRKKQTLGRYPALSLAQARSRRDESLGLLAQKIDPIEFEIEKANKERESQKNSLEAISKDWMLVKASTVSADYMNDIRSSLVLHLFPQVGHVPINQVTPRLLIDVLRPLEAKGNLETLRRVIQRLNEIMTFAVNTGLISMNPVANIKAAFKAPKPTNQLTIPPSELPTFLQRLSRAQVRPETRCLIEFQLHTMVRPNEASGAKWEEFNFEDLVWVIPSERMKSGRDHVIPLSLQVIEMLDFMRSISCGSLFVFPSIRNLHQPMCRQTPNQAIKRMGYENQLVAHGLRSIASTTLNEMGADPEVIEACLAHIDKNQVRRAYNRSTFLSHRKAIMQMWSDHITMCSQGKWSLQKSPILRLP